MIEVTEYRCPDCQNFWREPGHTAFMDCPECGKELVAPQMAAGEQPILVMDGVAKWDSGRGAWLLSRRLLPDRFTFGKAIGMKPVIGERLMMAYPLNKVEVEGGHEYDYLIRDNVGDIETLKIIDTKEK